MKLWMKIIISVVAVVCAIPLLAIGVFLCATSDMCGNYPHKEYLSPNKDYKAVVFQRDCGATTGFSTQISIIAAGDELDNEGGNIYVIKGHPEDVAPSLIWRSNSQLQINRPLNGKEYHAESEWGLLNKVKVTYSASNS